MHLLYFRSQSQPGSDEERTQANTTNIILTQAKNLLVWLPLALVDVLEFFDLARKGSAKNDWGCIGWASTKESNHSPIWPWPYFHRYYSGASEICGSRDFKPQNYCRGRTRSIPRTLVVQWWLQLVSPSWWHATPGSPFKSQQSTMGRFSTSGVSINYPHLNGSKILDSTHSQRITRDSLTILCGQHSSDGFRRFAG